MQEISDDNSCTHLLQNLKENGSVRIVEVIDQIKPTCDESIIAKQCLFYSMPFVDFPRYLYEN